MSIEVEFRLVGQDIDEKTLLDFIEWLERGNIDNIVIRRKSLPPVSGYQSIELDPNTILAIGVSLPGFLVSLYQLAEIFNQWRLDRAKSEVNFEAKLISEQEAAIAKQIQEVLDKMKQMSQNKK